MLSTKEIYLQDFSKKKNYSLISLFIGLYHGYHWNGANKIFFPKAGKDFVNVLFSFLTFPFGNIAIQMEKQSIEVWSLSSLYWSVANIDKVCLSKEMLLQLKNSSKAYMNNLKVNIDDILLTDYFVCNDLLKCRHKSQVLWRTSRNGRCRCGNVLAKPISPKSESCNVYDGDGFVKSNVSFIITDDLNVVSDSLDTIFYLLNNYRIEDVSLMNKMTFIFSFTILQVV